MIVIYNLTGIARQSTESDAKSHGKHMALVSGDYHEIKI